MKANVLSIAAFVLAAGGISVCWLFTIGLGHNDAGRLPFISETGTHAPERYVFTFTLSSAAVLFAISGYLLFRHLKDRFQDVADFYYGFAHDEHSGGVGGVGVEGGDDGRYDRQSILIMGSERMMLSLLPKANYLVLALSELACASLLFLAVVDLKEARYYHGAAAAVFFVLGIMQGLFLTSLTYFLRRVITLALCLFCTFPLAVVESVILRVAGIQLDADGNDAHNVGTVNQYLLTTSLLLHFVCYSSELKAVDVDVHLHFDAVDRIIALGGRGSLRSARDSTSFLEEGASLSDEEGKHFSIGDDEEDEEEEHGIRFVNKGSSSSNNNKMMHEIIPTEVLDLHS